MMKKEVTIKFVNGVEASPIALLVQTANRFSSIKQFHLSFEIKSTNAIVHTFCTNEY